MGLCLDIVVDARTVQTETRSYALWERKGHLHIFGALLPPKWLEIQWKMVLGALSLQECPWVPYQDQSFGMFRQPKPKKVSIPCKRPRVGKHWRYYDGTGKWNKHSLGNMPNWMNRQQLELGLKQTAVTLLYLLVEKYTGIKTSTRKNTQSTQGRYVK